ncbi:MAG: uracil-DNA glycosylase [Saprospiraceae bacterium]|nr:uracil-DNA glycosylase [Saprospiraceae bacterium]
MDVKIQKDWKFLLKNEFDQLYFEKLVSTVKDGKALGMEIYPPGKLIFNAFELTPPDEVKAVILGQDPYHNPGEAMGLCFSVPKGVRIPPSLVNIFKELKMDLGIDPPGHGDLTNWAQNGVLLLNSILTVTRNQPGSHKDFGWQQFTDAVIRKISDYKNHVVFMLWGNYAKGKVPLIDANKHLIITAAHPSPLARGGFFGHKPFSAANKFLESKGVARIDWSFEN